MPLHAGEREDRRGDRVGPDRHAAHQRRHVAAEQFEHPLADEPRPLRIERDLAAVEVVIRLLARGQRELAKSQGLFTHQSVAAHSRSYMASSPWSVVSRPLYCINQQLTTDH